MGRKFIRQEYHKCHGSPFVGKQHFPRKRNFPFDMLVEIYTYYTFYKRRVSLLQREQLSTKETFDSRNFIKTAAKFTLSRKITLHVKTTSRCEQVHRNILKIIHRTILQTWLFVFSFTENKYLTIPIIRLIVARFDCYNTTINNLYYALL